MNWFHSLACNDSRTFSSSSLFANTTIVFFLIWIGITPRMETQTDSYFMYLKFCAHLTP